MMDSVVLVFCGCLGTDAHQGGFESLADTALPFSPIKTIFFIGWFYLCLYSVQRSDNSPLVANKYRYLSNIAALMIGPLHLWVLFTADTVRRIQEGELSLRQVPSHILDTILEKPLRRKPEAKGSVPAIQLMDTSGRRFEELYAKQIRPEVRDRHIQESTEQMILAGINHRATDILLDPKDESEYTIRFRVDGFLRVHDTVDGKLCQTR
jgi:type II secretory ATPase GspE/PulE/Tfp pilus assembly ATPase PilB-like protein